MSEPDDFASPACSLHEMDDAYLGYFTREEIAPKLDALHAAVWVLRDAQNESLRAAAAQWAVTIAGHLALLDAVPSPATAEICESDARGDVVRLTALLMPKVRDAALQADLGRIRAALVVLP